MHICIIVGQFPPDCAGIGNYAYNLSCKLIEHGHKVTVFTRGVWNNNCIIENMNGINVYRVRFIPIYPFHVKIHGIFLNKKFKSLEDSFDLIHIHSPLVPIINSNLPIILTEHGTAKSDIDHIVSNDTHSKFLKLFADKFIDTDLKSIEQAHLITSVSKSCARDIQKVYGINREVVVVNNGVDTNHFRPSKKSITNEPYILYTGRLDSRKGLVDLVESAKFVCKKYPKMKFVLTGKGPNQKYLEKRIDSIGLKHNFTFLGFVDNAKLLEQYQNACIYVLPSYFEGLPTTLLEAMSCGLPVVATRVAGNSEVIIHGENGYLVSPRNPQQLGSTIVNLLDNDALRFNVGNAARKNVVENYDWKVVTSNIEELYHRISRNLC